MSENNFWIPKTLDAPALMLFFEVDTAITFVSVFCIFGMMNFFLGFFLAYMSAKMFIKLKDNGSKGMLLQMVYWYLPSGWMSKTYVSSIREYVGR